MILDIVARDKKGRPVRDLTVEQLRVFENDQRCEVRSFRLVEARPLMGPTGSSGAIAAPLAPGMPVTPGPASSPPPQSLVTMVFDRLDIAGNRTAEKAAREFVERGMDANTQVAVFRIGTRLGLVQPFTAEKDVLLRAIAAATAGKDLKDAALTAKAQQASRDLAIANGLASPGMPSDAGDASQPSIERVTGPVTQTTPGTPADSRGADFLTWIARALRMADGMQRQMESEWSLYPLLALVKAQSSLAGRKTLLFFSPGMQVSPHLQDVFKTVVSEANRSNVSVYSVDARGLQTRSDIGASGAALQEAATASLMQQMRAASDPTTVQDVQIMDTAQDSLTLNAQQTLSDLSEGTGGFLIANGNDFSRAVDRLAADIGGYYEVTYAPAVATLDGSFHRIEVKALRKDVVLQSRRGYFALPPSDQVVLPYEIPLFAALSARNLPHDFPHQAAALYFGRGPAGTETAVLVEVPLAPLEFVVDSKKKTFALRLTTLAVLKAPDGRIVERFSDEYPLGGPLEQLSAMKQSNAVLRRVVALPPGRYSLETATQVRTAGKTSVQRVTFEVPGLGPGPQLSSLSLLRRADPLPAGAPVAESDKPFWVEGMRLVPHLAGPVSKADRPNLSFFARVFPAAGEAVPQLTLDFVRDGKVVGRAEAPMPMPDGDGRIAYVGGAPSASLPPGPYQVRLTVEQGGLRATETTTFDLVP